MSQIETLSPLTHRTMGVRTEYYPQLGYNAGAVMVLPNELNQIQKDYPIVFRKHHETHRLFPVALLGFEEQENLFIDEYGKWDAPYIPMVMRKGPFLIGFRANDSTCKPVVLIDKDDPRVLRDGATRLFIGSGRPSEYLEEISELLVNVHLGAEMLAPMMTAFEQSGLLEPLQFEIEFIDGRQIVFSGAFTISEARLRLLSPAVLEELARHDYLSKAVCVANSTSNLSKLVDRKNNRLLSQSNRSR
ncbi:hypothetical protein DXV75_07430 [Alteromonas aestuariivivens]|uniref:Peptidase n=1 Tax=Alteromonas aestuariivivens TaxID=1938339 RepID=A0A3D8MAE3_9ALTE|nr:SapC family protein [Alteromonas aestuariivivens]RDV26810.1 hypothetical protein DXV75_07430 [Alteromonas aestuariivivens]